MAVQPNDTKTLQIPELTPTEKKWVQIGLQNIRKTLERNRSTVAPGAMYDAMTKDMEALANLKKKFA